MTASLIGNPLHPDKKTRKMLEYRELKWCFLISTDTSVCQIAVKVLLRKLGIVDNIFLNWKHFKSNSDHTVLLSFAHKSTKEGIKGYFMNVMHSVKNSSPNLVTYLVNHQMTGYFHSASQRKGLTCFRASDFHENFTRSSKYLTKYEKKTSFGHITCHSWQGNDKKTAIFFLFFWHFP